MVRFCITFLLKTGKKKEKETKNSVFILRKKFTNRPKPGSWFFKKNSKIIQFNKQPKINTKGEHVRMWYSNGSHSEIEVAHKYEDWTPESIRERWLHLLGFMEKRWNIDYEKKRKKNYSF